MASYVPAIRQGGMIYVSGQLPLVDGKLIAEGAVPSAVGVQEAAKGAARCVINGLAAADALLKGDWSEVERVIRVGVFVWGDPGFSEQHLVANGASDLLVRAFGDSGRHARAAVGVSGLPLGASVEVELWLGLAGSA